MPTTPINLQPIQPAWAVCDHCGQAHRWQALQPGAVATCVRCHAVLGRGHKLGLQPLLALTLAALIVLLIAQASPLISIRLAGAERHTSLPMAIATSWQQGEHLVALLAVLTAGLAPALFIGLRLYLLLPLLRGRLSPDHLPPGYALCLRLLFQASRWNTVEVLTVGALLALVRIADLAQATPGPGLAAFAVLALLLAAIESAGLRHLWWHVP